MRGIVLGARDKRQWSRKTIHSLSHNLERGGEKEEEGIFWESKGSTNGEETDKRRKLSQKPVHQEQERRAEARVGPACGGEALAGEGTGRPETSYWLPSRASAHSSYFSVQ